MEKTIHTYEALYEELLLLDNEHRIHRIEKDLFRIKLDKRYDINVYNNREGEVYLEYNAEGKQLTHYHPDYPEAYVDLAEVLQNPQKELERLINNENMAQKSTKTYMAVIILLMIIFIVRIWLVQK